MFVSEKTMIPVILTEEEKNDEILKNPKSYGAKCADYMCTWWHEEIEKMREDGTYLEMVHMIDKSAEDAYWLFCERYEKDNPRPADGFEEVAKWESTRKNLADSHVMGEFVLYWDDGENFYEFD